MDFFARQESSRRTTRYLVLLFGGAFLAVAVATAIAATFFYGTFVDNARLSSTGEGIAGAVMSNGQIFLAVVGGTMVLMILASLYRSATLSRGGGSVARMLGGTEIRGDDPDPLHQRLVNVVEEMAIASGLPVPEIYVLEQQSGINAFAAGLTHADAAVAVTRGCLERLTRAELQGVIAHEFSHVLNGDMRLNLRLMGFGFGILVLSLIGRWMLRGARFTRHRRGRGMDAGLFIGLALTIIGGIGVLLSRLIKAAVSRQREVLADASAVQFTREPMALAGALKKIGGYTAHLDSVETEEVSHMLFGRGTSSFRGWFATHPPLDQRIRALDPSFAPGDYPAAEPLPPPSAEGITVSALAGGVDPSDVTADTAGSIRSEAGAELHAAIPENLHHAAHSSESSYLLVLALAVSRDARAAEQQYSLLEAQIGSQRTALCRRLRADLAELDRTLWLPLLELSVPALKLRPEKQIEFLFELVERLAAADSELSLFEYVLQRMLRAYFDELGVAAGARSASKGPAVAQAVYTLLATVAAYGHDDDETAAAAFGAGLKVLSAVTKPAAAAALEACLQRRSLEALDDALNLLTGLSPKAKRQALEAVEATIRYDRRIELAEAELFRAIAATLGCPIPPARPMR